MNELIIKVSELTEVSVEDMKSKKRTKEICEARQIFMFLAYKVLGLTQQKISLFLNRSQQSVMKQITALNMKVDSLNYLNNKIAEIEQEIKEKPLKKSLHG